MSLRLAFSGVKVNFHRFNKANKNLVELIRNNLVGGPALIFDRFQEVGLTTIAHDPANPPTKTILGLGWFN